MDGCPYVLPSPNDPTRHLTHGEYYSGWTRVLKAAGVPHVGTHGIRHRATTDIANSLMTASYWEIGHRIVEAEQRGKRRAGYGEQLMARLSADLTARFGRGFSPDNLENMRRFFLAYPLAANSETLSRKSGEGVYAEGFSILQHKSEFQLD